MPVTAEEVLEVWESAWGDRYPLTPEQRQQFLAAPEVAPIGEYSRGEVGYFIRKNRRLKDALRGLQRQVPKRRSTQNAPPRTNGVVSPQLEDEGRWQDLTSQERLEEWDRERDERW